MAGQLHTNFYEGWLDRATVEDVLSQVARFVEEDGRAARRELGGVS